MPNFLNSFKMDDFVDRKNKKTKRIFSDCGLNDLNDFKQGLFAFYIKDIKASYDVLKGNINSIDAKKREIVKLKADYDKAMKNHLKDVKNAQKEGAEIKSKIEGERMEEQAKNKALADNCS